MTKTANVIKVQGRLDADDHILFQDMITAGAQERRLMVSEADPVSGAMMHGITVSKGLEVLLCRKIDVLTSCSGLYHGIGNLPGPHYMLIQFPVSFGRFSEKYRSEYIQYCRSYM